IEVIYQDFSLFPNLTVLENIALPREVAFRRRVIGWKGMRATASAALKRIGVDVDLDRHVAELSVAQRQLVAIARALTGDPKLIIMDEPTSALTSREIARLLEIIRQLRGSGVAVIFVTHKLDEAIEVADRVVVLRNGVKTFDESQGPFERDVLVRHMVGHDLASRRRRRDTPQGEVVLSVSGLSRAQYYRNVSFELHAGETLGLTGQLDSGRTALALSLYGMLPPESGAIRIAGRSVSLDRVADALASEIAMSPEDRLTEGLFLPRSVGANLSSGALSALSDAFGFLDRARISTFENTWIDRLSIMTPGPEAPVHSLSGGNQQRVVLGRVLSRRPRIVVLNGPTVGVDIGSKEEIHAIIEDMSAAGAGVLLVSDDADELGRLCGRVLVMNRGEIAHEIAGSDVRGFRSSEILLQE
ncbi:MAG TPA: sugar ABC transporter ATP-binding protein, partial [Roseiarcus sp.]|nr:sugar ABC transporter ATP-binding protein [Roseiarcus sp.]